MDGTLADTEEIHRQAFNSAFDEFKLGYASALTVILFLILLTVSGLQLWLMRKK